MALMEELLQQHNPVNLLRFLSEEQEQLPPPLLLKTSKCSFPNQGHTQAEKILLPAVLWNFLHSGKNAQEKTNNGKEGGTKAVSQNLIKPRSRITVSTWEKKRFGKGIKCESKERTCYYVQGKANGLQGTTPEDDALAGWSTTCQSCISSSQKKKARKLGVRVRTEFTGLFRIGLDSK